MPAFGNFLTKQPVLAALQTSLGDKSGLYLFPGLGVGENPTREQMNEGMKHMDEKLGEQSFGVAHVSRHGFKVD